MKRTIERDGFTLVELLAVMAIIGILATIIIGVSSYAGRKAKESRAIADMEKLKTAVEEYKIEFGMYPDTGTFNSDPDALKRFVSDVKFVDPWDRPYEYTKVSEYQYTILSQGATTNAEDDISTANGY